MSDGLERLIGDALADGRITDGDAEAVREFAEFLQAAGQPDGEAFVRLKEAGRWDLMDYAMPASPIVEASYWGSLEGQAIHDNTAGVPPYDVNDVAARILDAIPEHVRLLDLGCGIGRLTRTVANRIHGFVHGLDIARNLLDIAATDAPGNAKFWRGDGRSFPPGLGGFFTGAYSVAMFQHIPHDAMWGYLHQVHAHLQSGAPFLFTIAVGDTDMFLEHQIPDIDMFACDLMQLFDNLDVSVPDERGWTWVSVWKAE